MNKNGNNVLDKMDPNELIEYVMERFYGEIRDMVLENEIPDGE